MDKVDLLDLGSDRSLRFRLFTKASMAHPAKMHAGLLLWLGEHYTVPGQVVIDPMYGIGTTGLLALTQRHVVGFEVEPPYLAHARKNAALVIRAGGLFAGSIAVQSHDAREPWPEMADVVLFSPPYGCRASSNQTSRHYVSHKVYKLAKEKGIGYSERWHKFVENPTSGAAGAMTFFYGDHPAQLGHLRGDRYWQSMTAVYAQARVALRPGGHMILVVKDHIRDGGRVHVADATAALCERLGFNLVTRHARRVWPLSLWQRRRREQGLPIVETEDILILRN